MNDRRLRFALPALFLLLSSLFAPPAPARTLFGAPRGAPASAGTRPSAAPRSIGSIPDGAGGTYVGWSSTRDGVTDVYVQRLTNTGAVAAGWPAAGVPVCTAPGDQLEGALFPDGANGVIVGWLDFRDAPLVSFSPVADLYARRVDASGTPQWTANGVRILSSIDYGTSFTSVPDGTGGVILAWSQGTPGDIYALRVTGAGAVASGWSSTGTVVCDDPADQIAPVVAPDGAGGGTFAWEDARSGSYEIFAQRLDASGAAQWTANGIQVSGVLGGTSPAACEDLTGGALIFWNAATGVFGQHLDSGASAHWTAGGAALGSVPGGGSDLRAVADGVGGAYLAWLESSTGLLLRVQHATAAGAADWGASGVAVADTLGSRYVDDLVAESGGGATLVWEDFRLTQNQSDLYAQRLNAAGAPQWGGTNGLAICVAAGQQASAGIGSDGAGGDLVSWVDYRSLDPEVYAQRVSAAGAIQFAADGKAVVADPGAQNGAVTVPDGAGGMWIAWSQKEAGIYQVHAKRVGSGGGPVGNAITVRAAAYHQVLAGAAADGSGGVILAWLEERDGAADVYVQRLNAAGAPQWVANGLAIASGPSLRSDLHVVTDGAGGAILSWLDARNGNPDVYAQRVGAAGAVQWAAGGVAVCSDPGAQSSPVLAASASNGAVIAWVDLRSFLIPSVYAQRVDGSGAAQWAANGVSIAQVSFLGRCLEAVPDGAGGAIVLAESPAIVSPIVIGSGAGAVLGDARRAAVGQASAVLPRINHLVQRVAADGSALWSAGVLVADTTGPRGTARMVPDGQGGAIVAWSDGRRGVYGIAVQRLNAGGSLRWGPAGLWLNDTVSWQWMNALVPIGPAGAVLVWADERSGFADLYAQRIDSTGAAQWTANGVAVCAAARGQYAASACGDGSTGSRIAWTDFRSGTSREIYAQALDGSGAAQWTAGGVVPTLFSLASVTCDGRSVRLSWGTSLDGVATLYRSAGGAWSSLEQSAPDGTGRLWFTDSNIQPGATYGYHVGMAYGGREEVSSDVWVTVPSGLALTIQGLRPNPAVDHLNVAFTLPAAGAARLELLDVAGRRVLSRDLTGLEAGSHVVSLDGAAPAAGLYFLKLIQGGHAVSARAAVMR